ncbi:hypothetical protein FRB96_000953 [Tulasnella sp. 330]|nr:hypothetical protein FRB96_000953 [Tulasnella sp. 330]
MPGNGGRRARPRKIPITFIQDEHRRNTTFNSRKAEIIKMAYELSVLTGTELLFLAASETGLVSSFATAKLQPLVTEPKGKDLIKGYLDTPTEVAEPAMAGAINGILGP